MKGAGVKTDLSIDEAAYLEQCARIMSGLNDPALAAVGLSAARKLKGALERSGARQNSDGDWQWREKR